MDKGKAVEVENDENRHAKEIQGLHHHYKSIMVMLNQQMKSKEEAMEWRLKYERKNAKVCLLQKQISADNFDIYAEWARISDREEDLKIKWNDIKIPNVGFEKMSCSFRGYGGPYGDKEGY